MPLQSNKALRLLCVLLLILSWISVNIYLPALPALSHVFQTSETNLKFSLTLFFASFAIAQLFWGPLSEKYGRKKPLLIGMILTSVGVAMAMLADSVTLFNIGRFIEAAGLGCAPVLGRAILSDALDKVTLSITWAYTTITANIMPALAPIIGGHLMVWFGWRFIFLFLLIYSVSLYFSTYKHLPETHTHIRPDLQLKHVLLEYWEACTHREFMGYLLPYILVTGAMVGYYAVTPFIFVSYLHISAENYGFFSLVTVATYVIGAVINRFLSVHFEIKKLVILGTSATLLAALVCCIIAMFYTLNIVTVLLPMSIFTFAAGFISPSSNTGALVALRHLAGAGSAIAGAGLYAVSAILSTIATMLPLTTLWPLAIYISVIAIIVFVGFFFMVFLLDDKNSSIENTP